MQQLLGEQLREESGMFQMQDQETGETLSFLNTIQDGFIDTLKHIEHNVSLLSNT